MRLNRYIFVLCTLSIVLCMTGCRPKGILHSWEMREVLVDLHKTDALLQMNGLNNASSEDKALYYSQVLSKHGVTQAQFDSSLVWYTAHPQLFDKIYPKVLNELKAEEEAFMALHEEELQATVEAPAETVEQAPFTQVQLDSTLWVMQHGGATMWQPLPFTMCPADTLPIVLVHNSED